MHPAKPGVFYQNGGTYPKAAERKFCGFFVYSPRRLQRKHPDSASRPQAGDGASLFTAVKNS